MRIASLVFSKRNDRNSPPDSWSYDLPWQNPRLGANYGAALHAYVIAKTHLTADHAVVFDDHTARRFPFAMQSQLVRRYRRYDLLARGCRSLFRVLFVCGRTRRDQRTCTLPTRHHLSITQCRFGELVKAQSSPRNKPSAPCNPGGNTINTDRTVV